MYSAKFHGTAILSILYYKAKIYDRALPYKRRKKKEKMNSGSASLSENMASNKLIQRIEEKTAPQNQIQ